MLTSSRINLIVAILTLLVLVVDLLVPLGVACGILYTGVVLFAQLKRSERFILGVASTATALTIFGYFNSPSEGAIHWMVLTNRALSVYVIWVTALMALKINRQHKEELKTVSGLLPICAWCKNIRDDQGYWTQLETFLKKNSKLDCSHSICPECLEKQLAENSKVLEKENGGVV